jgi:hypothetical protein
LAHPAEEADMASGLARTRLPAACLVALALSACGKPQGQDEMTWARAALERNQRVEIVAVDLQSRSFTVRLKDTGELRMVRADQVIGAPGMPPAATAPAGTADAPEPATAATSPVAASGSAAAQAASADVSAQRAAETPSPPPAPKVFASRAVQPGSPQPAPGQVLEAGPGYSIEAGSGGQAGAAGVAREPGAASAAVELRHEPIVCQGARLLHIDNRNLQFDGDAVSAEDGCEIHITNSRIRATGVGVSARAANVHIDNSLIEGDAASIDASHGAQIYTASSHFRGLSRQLDTAAVHDLGGNVWN